MQSLSDIKTKISSMAALALDMWKAAYRAFIEHDLETLSKVLSQENELNNFEKELTSELVEFSRKSEDKKEKSQAIIYADVVGDLELIGDYCKDILERVQIKIEEKLLFSEEAVREYGDLYRRTEGAISEVASALERDDFSNIKEVLKKEEHIDTMVDQYRNKHNQRMIEGLCSPIACNMFLNILDFTAAVYYHAKKIARNLIKINEESKVS